MSAIGCREPPARAAAQDQACSGFDIADNEIGVEPRILSDFRAGDAELPAEALDRLIEVLGLRLMQEIAR